MPPEKSPSRPTKRFRVAGDVGLAQLTLVEHALCPLDRNEALRAGSLYEVHYAFTDRHRNRKTATANVACPFGLSPNDELYLYGLLALTFAQPEPTFDFYATPDWCLRQLGITATGNEQSKRYATFRAAVRRLAGVVYENDRFYDPVRGEHRDVAFGLLKYSLPIDPASSRAWHFVWDPQFFRFCEATAGSFQFDMELYRSLDYASRRMFLLLQKIFWRNDHSPAFDIRDLAVNALGFAPTIPTKLLKQKLCRVATSLLEKDVLTLPLHATSTKDLFTKQRPGVHTVQFWRGPHFDRSAVADPKPIDSPLVEPLTALGFEPPAIRRILRDYPPRLIQEWADIALAAKERKMIRQSPQAYFTHYIREAAAKRTTPPDWWREARRQEFAAERVRQDAASADNQEREFEKYLRGEAQEAFERVTDRLFQKLKGSGQSEPDARVNAENAARMHLRRSFHEARPAADHGRPSRVADILKNRWQKPGQ